MPKITNKIPHKIMMLPVIVALMLSNTIFAAAKSNSKALARDSNLSSLNISQAHVTSWASTALMQVLSMNYLTLRKDFSNSSKLFTVKAWAAFSKSLKQSGILDKLHEDKLGMRAVPTDVPLISNQGNVSGNYSWTVNIPVLIVMANKSEHITHHWSVDLVVERSPSYIGVDGLAIRELIAKPIEQSNHTVASGADDLKPKTLQSEK